MPIPIECSCGHKGTVPDSFDGKTVKCPKCKQAILAHGAKEWFYFELTERRGPFSFAAFVQLAREKDIGPDTRVQRGLAGELTAACNVLGLFGKAPQTTASRETSQEDLAAGILTAGNLPFETDRTLPYTDLDIPTDNPEAATELPMTLLLAFACPYCGECYDVDIELAGKAIQCRECREFSRVLAPPKPPPDWRSVAKKDDTNPRTVSHPAPENPSRDAAILLLVIGCGLLIGAFLYNSKLDAQDSSEQRLTSSVNEVNKDLSEILRGKYSSYDYKEANTASRTLVYVLGGIGALFIGLAIVVFAIDASIRRARQNAQTR